MTALVRAELRQLRATRTTWVLLAVASLLCLTGAVMVMAGVGGIDAPPRGSTALRDTLLRTAGIGAFPVLLLSVLAVAGEFHHRTVTPTFIAVPHRSKLVAAKTVTCALFALVAGIPLMAIPLAAGTLAGAIELTLDDRFLRLLAGSFVMFACWALLGVGLGSLIHNQTAAVLVPLLWFGVVETLLPAYPALRWLNPWLPGSLTSAIAGDLAPVLLPGWVALLVFLGYVVVLMLAGTRRIVGMDVT